MLPECWWSVLTVWAQDSLGQVSAGARLLGPVRLGDAEGVAQRWYAGLQVELGGLSQVRLLAKVVEVKQRGAAFHLSLHQGGRSDLHTAEGELQFPDQESDGLLESNLKLPKKGVVTSSNS